MGCRVVERGVTQVADPGSIADKDGPMQGATTTGVSRRGRHGEWGGDNDERTDCTWAACLERATMARERGDSICDDMKAP